LRTAECGVAAIDGRTVLYLWMRRTSCQNTAEPGLANGSYLYETTAGNALPRHGVSQVVRYTFLAVFRFA